MKEIISCFLIRKIVRTKIRICPDITENKILIKSTYYSKSK